MLKTVEGVYRDGKIELAEQPVDVKEARVIVTFLPNAAARKQPPDFTPEELAELRWRFQSFAEDWERPEMDVYNDYPSR